MIDGLATRTNARYGWRPDTPDVRDETLTVEHVPSMLPRQVSLREKMPPVYDQGQLGSCTAHAIAALLEFDGAHEGENVTTPSRLFIYYNERAMEGTIESDAGAEIRDGIKSVAQIGAPPENTWPYVEGQFARKPPAAAYEQAKSHRAVQYKRVAHGTSRSICAALAAGFPVAFGFTVYESFESDSVAKTGLMPMPGGGEKTLGGHAVALVGYDLDKELWEVRNSWGPDWGDHGYFWMPEAYLVGGTLARDFWTISTVS